MIMMMMMITTAKFIAVACCTGSEGNGKEWTWSVDWSGIAVGLCQLSTSHYSDVVILGQLLRDSSLFDDSSSYRRTFDRISLHTIFIVFPLSKFSDTISIAKAQLLQRFNNQQSAMQMNGCRHIVPLYPYHATNYKY